jgi:hypothetical protein
MGHLDPHKDHHTLGVSYFDYNLLGNKNEEGRKRSKQQESTKNTNKCSLKSLSGWSGFGTWRGFDSFDLCLEVNALALVLNENLRKLGCLEWWWLGVFIALNHQQVVRGGCYRWAHRTVRCTSHVTQPLGFGSCRPLEALSSSGTGQTLFNVRCVLTLRSDSVAHCCAL